MDGVTPHEMLNSDLDGLVVCAGVYFMVRTAAAGDDKPSARGVVS